MDVVRGSGFLGTIVKYRISRPERPGEDVWTSLGDWLSRYDTNRISRERFGTARTYPGEDDCVDVVGNWLSRDDRLIQKNQTEVWKPPGQSQVKMTMRMSLGSGFLGTSVRSRITEKKSGTATTATGEDVWMSLASGLCCTILTD